MSRLLSRTTTTTTNVTSKSNGTSIIYCKTMQDSECDRTMPYETEKALTVLLLIQGKILKKNLKLEQQLKNKKLINTPKITWKLSKEPMIIKIHLDLAKNEQWKQKIYIGGTNQF